jgi:ketosteroid isomerase-like protein
MSEIEQLCRRAYEVYGQADFDSLLELFDPDVEVYVAPPNFESGRYHGHAEYRALIERWGTAWAEMRIEPRELTVTGDWVLAKVDYIGKTPGSDLEVTQPSWEVSQWIDGRCRSYEVYWEQDAGERAFEERSA